VAEVIFKAGSSTFSVDVFTAKAQGKNPFKDAEGLPDRTGARKRAEVTPAVLLEAAGNINARPIFFNVYFQVREGLIILEKDVIGGTVLLDKIALHDKRFLFGAGDVKINVGYPGDQTLNLGRQFAQRLEVRPDAVGEVLGFADVKNILLNVPVYIDAGAVGQTLELFGNNRVIELFLSVHF